jgi:predicted ATPase
MSIGTSTSGALEFLRGSEWRRWDLHVHTPRSALNEDFGGHFGAYAKLLFEEALRRDVAVIGVTDYFTVEGYRELRELLGRPGQLEDLLGDEQAQRARRILLLPNVELRSREIIRAYGKDSRVNFHVLFSDEISPEDIEEHFLRELRFTAESAPDGPDEQLSLTVANLERLGQRLKAEHAPFRSESDLRVGMLTAVVSHEDVRRVLDRQQRLFKDRYLFVVPADEDLSTISWDGQGHVVRKVLLQKAHMFFSANPGTRAFGLGHAHESVEAFLEEFKSRKACIHGSDAHDAASLFEPDQRRYLWIRADPTFNGLRQLLHEPDTRVYLGERPPALAHVAENATKYFSQLTFSRTSDATPAQRWFEGTVPLSHGLIAIIGNKGSGKSALADVLALLGDARSQPHFSFLTKNRFLAPKLKFGRMFQATLQWQAGPASSRTLDEQIDSSAPERIKYIPQSYLEHICSELQEDGPTAFNRELEDVIFSHVDAPDRLGHDSLPELLAYRTAEKEAAIEQVVAKLRTVNRAVVALQDSTTAEHRAELEGRIAQREEELRAHDAARPAEVAAPSTAGSENPETSQANEELAAVVATIEDLDEQIRTARGRLETLSRQLSASDRLLARIANLEAAVAEFFTASAGDAVTLDLDVTALVRLTVDRQPLQELRASIVKARAETSASVSPDEDSSFVRKRTKASEAADRIRARLDEPNRRHQEYLHQLAKWTQRRAQIVGAVQTPEALEGLRAALAELSQAPRKLQALEGERLGLTRQIFALKRELLDDYQQLYSPVQRFVEAHAVSQETGALQFSASIAADGLEGGLLGMLHQGRKGSFQGEQDGRERLRALVARSDLATIGGVETFVGELEDLLTNDHRETPPAPTQLRRQLLQGVEPRDVYDYLFGLGYLRPRFELLWRDKPLDQLSPGERGTLLLVFYLLIDRREVPLIIDQPEENLDNETITELLVPAIKFARERRQVVIVTHNPNLAVVCDADQIIHAYIDKANGNRITYTSGSIEDPRITELIVNVLEGTKPAFDLRDAKYDVLERPREPAEPG